ncbi:MAG TPA: carboxylate-amine ligase, partial [Hyphomicrobiales bacterium]|nr:carboxylate-amine ligase [Hyphomicrobiales bacterium]
MADEACQFQKLQQGLTGQFREIFSDTAAPRTVLIVPSLTLDQEVLAKISGARHYEQRMLCLLLLLRFPHTHVIYVTSEPIPQAIIDYYLHLLPGIPRDHAQKRLTLLCCHDSSDQPLTEKILSRPRLMERIRGSIAAPERAHMTCFNVAEPERRLALRLGIPIYGCDPDLLPLGSKSGSRAVFREAGLKIPDGFEDLANADAIIEALTELKARTPSLRRAVVKLNEGFSGEGNAIFDFSGAPAPSQLGSWIADHLPRMAFVARDMDW